MKKILLILSLFIVLSGCVEQTNGDIRVINKIDIEKRRGHCYSKYYFNEHDYVSDICNKWNVGDTIK